jgi:hypothetical protein
MKRYEWNMKDFLDTIKDPTWIIGIEDGEEQQAKVIEKYQ